MPAAIQGNGGYQPAGAVKVNFVYTLRRPKVCGIRQSFHEAIGFAAQITVLESFSGESWGSNKPFRRNSWTAFF